MSKYTIVHFENDDFYQVVLDLALDWFNFEPSIKVSNKDEARTMIKQIEIGEIKPDYVFVDSYIGIDNEDGSKIAEKVRALSPSTKIVGYAIMETKPWADYEIIKSNRDNQKCLLQA